MFFRTAPKGPESSKPSRRLGALFLSSIFPLSNQKFGSARLAAGRRPPSVRLSKCFCGRLQIVPKAPPVKKSEHSARRGPPNSRGTVVHGFPFFESRFRELVFLSEPGIIGFPNSHDRVYRLDSSQVSGFRIPVSPGS